MLWHGAQREETKGGLRVGSRRRSGASAELRSNIALIASLAVAEFLQRSRTRVCERNVLVILTVSCVSVLFPAGLQLYPLSSAGAGGRGRTTQTRRGWAQGTGALSSWRKPLIFSAKSRRHRCGRVTLLECGSFRGTCGPSASLPHCVPLARLSSPPSPRAYSHSLHHALPQRAEALAAVHQRRRPRRSHRRRTHHCPASATPLAWGGPRSCALSTRLSPPRALSAVRQSPCDIRQAHKRRHRAPPLLSLHTRSPPRTRSTTHAFSAQGPSEPSASAPPTTSARR